MDTTKHSCRLCLASSPEQTVSISDSAMRSKMDVVFRFELPLEDSLPTVVCHECNARIDEFYSYHETVRTNQNQLKDLPITDANTLLLVEVKGEPADDLEEAVPEEDAAECQIQDDPDMRPGSDLAQSDLDKLETTVKKGGLHQKRKKSMESNLKIEQFFSGKILCGICPVVSETFDQLVAHSKKKHGKNAKVTCCKRNFKKCNLLEHIDVHLDPTQFNCELCNKNYKSKYSLALHMAQVHANPEEHHYQCSKCGKKFPKESQLKKHLTRHIQVQCTVCDRMMADAFSLKTHMRLKHSDETRIHMCDTCGQSFGLKQALERHINIKHQGGKDTDRVQCTVCDQWFNSKYYLRHHTLVAHSDQDLQETCTICHQVYRNHRALLSHKQRVHTKRNLECEICGKNFKLPKHLKEHRAAHMGQRLYSCTVCEYTSNYSANLYAHTKSKHPAQWTQMKTSGGSLLADHNEPMGTEVD